MKNNPNFYFDNMEKLGPLGQALECSVCLEVLGASSRVLPCQHTFCESCLIDISNSHKELRCPECRVLVTVPLQDLPPNILLMRVLESIKKFPRSNFMDTSMSVVTNDGKEKKLSEKTSLLNTTSFSKQSQQASITMKTPYISQNTDFTNGICHQNSSLQQLAHNITTETTCSVNYNPFLSPEPIIDESSIANAIPTDFFPTDFSSSPVNCSNSANCAINLSEMQMTDKLLYTPPTTAPKNSSLTLNSSLNEEHSLSTLSSIDPSEGANLVATSGALVGQTPSLLDQNVDEVQKNRRKSMNMTNYTRKSDSFCSVPPREVRRSLTGTFSGKNKMFMNKLATALYSYSQKEFWDLSFKKGDVITIMQKIDDNWYQGKLCGQVGFVPSSYIKIQESPTNFPQCLALFDFKISTENMKGLSFHKGDVITVLRRVDENWAEGKFSSKIGIFPLSFVEMNDAAISLLNSTPQKLIRKASSEKKTQVENKSVINLGPTTNLIDIGAQPLRQDTSVENQDNVYECIHPYHPSKGDELQLNKGSLYSVNEICKDGWFRGRCLTTDKVGVFPGNYVSFSNGENSSLTFQDRENYKNRSNKEKIDGNLLVNEFNNCTVSPTHLKTSENYSPSVNEDLAGTSWNILQKPDIINKFQNSKKNIDKSEEKAKEPKISRPPVPLMRERYRCSVPYPPSNPDELELWEGDVVYVHRKMDDGWFKGTLQRTGESGLFPSTFVDPY